MKRVHIKFPSGDIQLEGCWHIPDNPGPWPSVIVCHPHPLNGGDMNNNVVFTLCETLAERNIAALRFNYRGVGNSGGTYGDGIGEQSDVRAALALVESNAEVDTERLGLAGYSFGAHAGVPVAAGNQSIKRLALIAPYLTDPEWAKLESYERPIYIIHGDRDFVISSEAVIQHLGDRLVAGSYEVLEQTDHYLMGCETVVAGKVTDFFTAGFNQA